MIKLNLNKELKSFYFFLTRELGSIFYEGPAIANILEHFRLAWLSNCSLAVNRIAFHFTPDAGLSFCFSMVDVIFEGILIHQYDDCSHG